MQTYLSRSGVAILSIVIAQLKKIGNAPSEGYESVPFNVWEQRPE
jgi:hypothetical protein